MYTDVVVPIITAHPNADALELAHIEGWQCVLRKGEFSPGEAVLYVRIDTLLPSTVFSPEKYPYMKFTKRNSRGESCHVLKTLKLRGEVSQGLLVAIPEGCGITDSDELDAFLGIERWEPPVPAEMQGDTIREPSLFEKYPKITNGNDGPHAFDGMDVIVTEKLHGSNQRVGLVLEGDKLKYVVGSHNCAKDPDGQGLYSRTAREYLPEEKLRAFLNFFGDDIRNLIIFGEVYGSGVQDLTYGCKPGEQRLRIFDVLLNGRYLSWDETVRIADHLGLVPVPVLYRGPYSLETTLKLRDGVSTLGNHVREGVVVRTSDGCGIYAKGGYKRGILKFISPEYLLRKNATDGH